MILLCIYLTGFLVALVCTLFLPLESDEPVHVFAHLVTAFVMAALWPPIIIYVSISAIRKTPWTSRKNTD